MCLAIAGFFAGKASKSSAAQQEREQLYALNRSSIENIKKFIVDDGPIYVIGHRSPDSDTVCSAIAYVRFLTLAGYDAQAAITEPVNHETAFILLEQLD